MITCPECNKELSDDTNFCNGCGDQIFETIFCPNCGTQTSVEFFCCQNCGTSIIEVPTEQQTSVTTPQKKHSKKKIIFFGIGIGIIMILVLIISLFSSDTKSVNNYSLYLKNEEIFFTDLKKNSKAWQLTSRLVDSDKVENEGLDNSSSLLGLYTYISKDGKYIFFPDKVGEEDDIGINLYYRDVKKHDLEAIKVDSDIRSYTINTSANLIIYLKGEEGNLYMYDIDEESKYNIASDISTLEYVTEDSSTVYYIKDGALYKQVIGEDRVKVSSDIWDIVKIYDTGEMYYLKSETKKNSLMYYVIDDMKDADASVNEPNYPDYPNAPSRPSPWDFDTDYEFDAAYATYEDAYETWESECNRIKNEYNATLEAYNEKLSRDELRESLENETLEQTNYSLCFYNGTEEVVITDAFVSDIFSIYNCTYASKSPVVAYKAYNQSNLEKVKLSEIESISDFKKLVNEELFSSSERYIAVKEVSTVIEQEKEATMFTFNPSGTIVYYIDDIAEGKDYGGLYRIVINNGIVEKAELYDSDVFINYEQYFIYVISDKIVYYKDYKNDKGDLYINKNKIDFDVSYCFYTDLNNIFYFTDWSDEKKYGTLKVYDGNETIKIADDVHDSSITPDGQVLYLCNYSLNYYTGELQMWDNGKTRKLDNDVVSLINNISYSENYSCYLNGNYLFRKWF